MNFSGFRRPHLHMMFAFLWVVFFCSACHTVFFQPSSRLWQERQLIESSICLLENKNELVPLKGLENKRMIVLSSPENSYSTFKNFVLKYHTADTISFGREFLSPSAFDSLLTHLSSYDLVILAAGQHDGHLWRALQKLKPKTRLVLCLFGEEKRWHLTQLAIKEQEAVLFCPVASTNAQELVAQALMGAFLLRGQLESQLMPTYQEGYGLFTKEVIRLKYTIPEELGINERYLEVIDSLAESAIIARATPSCQVLLAKNGKIFYHKAFGHHTYDSLQKASLTDIYDVASVSKITTGLLPLMRFYEQGRVNLDSPLVQYLSAIRGSNKDSLTLRSILAHQARLQASLPFYSYDFKDGKLDPNYYSQDSSAVFSLPVAKNLYIKPSYYKEVALQTFAKSRLSDKKGLLYSDLGFVVLPAILDSFMRKPYKDYLQEEFYAPLGAWRSGFNPIFRFGAKEIVPTELDMYFRKQLVHGYVHDESAAVLGGYSANAGLFTTAEDLAKILQMYLNKGKYAGKRFFEAATMDTFTRCQFCETGNRRGLGFDKPAIQYSRSAHTAQEASAASFGHLGFTGTYIWADPQHDLIYIFLSNRVYPTRENNLLSDRRVRLRIMEAAYRSISK